MSRVKGVVSLVVLTFLWTFNRGDAEVCVLMQSCILPCSFQPGDDVVIHWIQVTKGNLPAHSFYHNQDQLAHQDQRFSRRTTLFKDQISRGNASLRLTGVEVQDQGKYKCYTSTITGNAESIIILNVEAPVRKVDIWQVGNRITCSSEGIYPEPELTWSTSPPSNRTLPDTPTFQRTEQQLYNISSSVIVSDSVTDLVYSCTVGSGSSRRTATLFKTTSIISGSGTEPTIPCTSPNTPQYTDLIWRFNHSQVILRQPAATVSYIVSVAWRERVKSVSGSGSLTLRASSSNQEGTYTCELRNAEETYVTNTFLRMEESEVSDTSVGTSAGIAVGVILVAVLAILAALVVLYKKNLICKRTGRGNGKVSDVVQTDEERENNVMLDHHTTED